MKKLRDCAELFFIELLFYWFDNYFSLFIQVSGVLVGNIFRNGEASANPAVLPDFHAWHQIRQSGGVSSFSNHHAEVPHSGRDLFAFDNACYVLSVKTGI